MFDFKFKVGNIISLRKELKNFPCLKDMPDYHNTSNVMPYYLGPLMDGFVLLEDTLIVLEVFDEKNKTPYAYRCLHKDKIIYLVKMKDAGIDPNICFEVVN